MKKMVQKFLAAVLALSVPAMVSAADVTLTVSQIVKGGLDASSGVYTTSGISTANTYKFSNDGKILLHFEKTGASDATVTITTPGTFHGLAISDQSVTVGATTGDVFVGPFPISLFNDSSGNVSFTVDETTGLSFAALRL